MVKKQLQRHIFFRETECIVPSEILEMGHFDCYDNGSEIRFVTLKSINLQTVTYGEWYGTTRPTTICVTPQHGESEIMDADEFFSRLEVISETPIYKYEGDILYGVGEYLPFRVKEYDTHLIVEVDLCYPAHNNNTIDGYHGVNLNYIPNLQIKLRDV